MAQAIYEGIRAYSLKDGPRICESDDRDVVIWEERAKLSCTEQDLELNYNLLREVLINLLPYGETIPQHHFQVGNMDLILFKKKGSMYKFNIHVKILY